MKSSKLITLVVCVITLIVVCVFLGDTTSVDEVKNDEICRKILNREIIVVGSEKLRLPKDKIQEYNDLTTKVKLLASDIVITTLYGNINSREYMNLTVEERSDIDRISDYMLYENVEQYIKRDGRISHQVFWEKGKYADRWEKINNHTDIKYFDTLKKEYSDIIEELMREISFSDEIILEYVDNRMVIPGELIKRYSGEKQSCMNKYNHLTADVFTKAYEVAYEYIIELPGEKNTETMAQYVREISDALLYEESADIIYNSSLSGYFSLEKAGSGGAWPRFLAERIENAEEYYQVVEELYNNIK